VDDWIGIETCVGDKDFKYVKDQGIMFVSYKKSVVSYTL
jgi:hypothetical protein